MKIPPQTTLQKTWSQEQRKKLRGRLRSLSMGLVSQVVKVDFQHGAVIIVVQGVD
jgi:molybdopterin-binding protein